MVHDMKKQTNTHKPVMLLMYGLYDLQHVEQLL